MATEVSEVLDDVADKLTSPADPTSRRKSQGKKDEAVPDDGNDTFSTEDNLQSSYSSSSSSVSSLPFLSSSSFSSSVTGSKNSLKEKTSRSNKKSKRTAAASVAEYSDQKR